MLVSESIAVAYSMRTKNFSYWPQNGVDSEMLSPELFMSN